MGTFILIIKLDFCNALRYKEHLILYLVLSLLMMISLKRVCVFFCIIATRNIARPFPFSVLNNKLFNIYEPIKTIFLSKPSFIYARNLLKPLLHFANRSLRSVVLFHRISCFYPL